MRRRLRRAPDGADVDMTPMLDIVFILLIFFIVTATFLQEKGIEMISPPPPENEVPNQTESILIQIDDTNSVYVNGRLTDIARVTAAVQRANVDSGGSAAVVIQPTLLAEHGVVTRVFDAARTAGTAAIVRKPEPGN